LIVLQLGCSFATFSAVLAGREKRLLFHKMFGENKDYSECVKAKGKNFSTESLFLILIVQQQKMINELMAMLEDIKNH